MNSSLFSVKTGVLFQSHSGLYTAPGFYHNVSLSRWSGANPGGRPSAFSDFGGECRVLLSNSLVVVENPLQVSHSFTTVFCLNLLL